MKKLSGILIIVALFAAACSKDQKPPVDENQNPSSQTSNPIAQRTCGSMEVLQRQLQEDPALRQRMESIEQATQRLVQGNEMGKLLPNGIIEIPVVINILYANATQNISDAQIQSQINVLNADFSGSNPETPPGIFANSKCSTNIRFRLKSVVRKSTTTTSWGTNDAMKRATSGGINPTSPDSVLNIWVCNLGGGVLGYAQFPGGAAATDGVVITFSGFGTIGTAAAPFNKGRTATHEIGHWLNLRHIWGDANCGNDFVGDTPLHNAANFGCPTYPHRSTCTGTPIEQTMNYMDYSDDACMYLFTCGQRDRMMATFVAGGPRNGFAQP